jgi:CubicO group peptidase (beta-lactamase class C family)
MGGVDRIGHQHRVTGGRLSNRLAAVVLIGMIAGCGTASPNAGAPSSSALPSHIAQELGSFPPLTDEALSEDLAARLQAQLDAVVERDETPSISASVILPGVGRWEGTSGTTPEGDAVSSDTVFSIASITKTVVAAAALQLAEDDVLDLDDQLAEHLPPEIAEVTNGATLRDALGMRTGLQEQVNPADFEGTFIEEPDRSWTPEESVAVLNPEPAFPPDERTIYANVNYVLLGMAVEAATGRSMDTILREGVLAPAELARMVLQDAERPAEPLSASYPGDPALPSGDASLEVGGGFVPSRAFASAVWTAGSMASDAPTLATWGYLLYGGFVLSAASLEAMQAVPEGADYGLGCAVFDQQGLDGVGHGGLLPGFSSISTPIVRPARWWRSSSTPIPTSLRRCSPR